MLKRKVILIEDTEMTLGEFDPAAEGAYRNVKTMPLEIRPKKDLYVRIASDVPIDIAISDSDGRCIGFRDRMREGVLGPVPLMRREVLALMLGVFRGDLASIRLEAWME